MLSWLRTALLPLLLALAPVLSHAQSDKNVVTTPRVRAELLAHAPEGVAPGKPLWVGLQLSHQPEWHTYWKNAGDSGLPTQLRWTLPAGVSAGEIAWPIPRKIPVGSLANYGYDGTVLLPVPLTVGADFKPSILSPAVDIKLHANWLVCKQECIPEEGDFELRIPASSSTALNSAAFDAAFKAQPKPLAGDSHVDLDGDAIRVSVRGLPAAVQGKPLALFPETPEVVENAPAPQQAWQGDTWTARVPISLQRSQSPTTMPIVLASGSEGWRVEAPVRGTWPAVAAAAGLPPALQEALRNTAITTAPVDSSFTWGAALLGALLGGLILNLMPCVFPILAIKVVAFTRHADDRRGHRIAGLSYTAGVIVSFLGLAALMLGLRAAGEQLGWGFQLQSPAFVAALAALFTVIALNLAGVFEFGAFLPSRLASFEARHPVGNAFLSGVLAVAIASPCTAPFMGASLGFAIGLPAWQALLVFAALGVGMALPYLAASLFPAVAALLPRPGPWMVTFRKLMAFPMLGTVVWLVWVIGQQVGIDGAAALLALLVLLAMGVWALTLAGKARVVLAGIAALALALAGSSLGGAIARPAPQVATASEGSWQPWQPGRVDQIVASGQPVFVDFTAAWCVTCQYNKRTTLSRTDVMADFSAKKVALLRADWTRQDPAITAALGQLGRSGVPVYVLYAAGHTPVVMSEVLGADELRAALAKL